MGSMADAVNAQESKPEAVEALSHGAASVEETGPRQTALPDPGASSQSEVSD